MSKITIISDSIAIMRLDQSTKTRESSSFCLDKYPGHGWDHICAAAYAGCSLAKRDVAVFNTYCSDPRFHRHSTLECYIPEVIPNDCQKSLLNLRPEDRVSDDWVAVQ